MSDSISGVKLKNEREGHWLVEMQAWLEYLGGARDTSPRGGVPRNVLFWAAWWTALLLWVWVFSGQTSRFIYIDF